ncbi:MAG TPA: DUF2721 domain-containing protein [Bdellovibrionota bacterium]|jgi:hypothetical protein|nr:DUF2721 domain-containing protein [Bdellovibrionota bacterium]
MEFTFQNFLMTVGPTASLIFASWAFLIFVQMRSSSAYGDYRNLHHEHRTSGSESHRETGVRPVVLHKRRCQQIGGAIQAGVLAALLFTVTLFCGALEVMVSGSQGLKYIGSISTLLGLVLLVGAAGLVVSESVLARRAIAGETRVEREHREHRRAA